MSDNELFWPEWGSDPDPTTRPTTPIASSPEPSPSLPAQPARRRPAWFVPATAAGLAALVFGGAGVGIGVALDHEGSTSADGGFTIAGSPVSTSASSPRSFAAIAAKVLPSVVSVNVRGNGGADTGSGVVLRSDGY